MTTTAPSGSHILAEAQKLLDSICHLEDKTGKEIFPRVELPETASGTARKWFEARHGKEVALVQFSVQEGGMPTNVWVPGARTVDASRATFVEFDGSKRDYRGLRVEAASDSVLVASTEWGDGRQVCIYT